MSRNEFYALSAMIAVAVGILVGVTALIVHLWSSCRALGSGILYCLWIVTR